MKKLIYLTLVMAVMNSCSKEESPDITEPEVTVTDTDGNIYNTITVGNQVWMAENLKTTSYNDGTPIIQYQHQVDVWHDNVTQNGYYQWADNEFDTLPFDYYGVMYNHFAIESGMLAPEGWRIPTIQDFMELENYLSNNGQAGTEATALKSTTGWLANYNGTDNIGFTGLPNGYVASNGSYFQAQICVWATSTVNSQTQRRSVINLFDVPTILFTDHAIQLGSGIRCIKE